MFDEPTNPDRIKRKLQSAGIRATQQRVMLAGILFNGGDRHISAEALFEETKRLGSSLSLATVYNTLRQFTDAGLLRPIAVDGTKCLFDTNLSDHYHFIVEGEDELIDFSTSSLISEGVFAPPPGYEVSHINVLVRLKKVGPSKKRT